MAFIKSMIRLASWRVLLVVPVIVYVSIALLWQSRGFYKITGDEPHYLLITESLVRDHDLQIANNYLTDNPVRQASAVDLTKDLDAHTYNKYSRHTIGLPLLLAIPYSIAGIAGAKVFMALLSGLWPLLLFKVLFQITLSRGWSLITALVLAIGLPFSAASNQIYPDLLAGMIILYAAWRIFSGIRDNNPPLSLATNISVSLLIAFLPWLHVRLGATTILLAVAYSYALARGPYPAARALLRWRYVIPLGLSISSLLLLTLYHRVTFGTVSGPFSGSYFSFRIKEVAMVFFGLHWDQSQGMFVQQPMLLLGLVGIPALIREHRRGAILVGLLYCSVVAPAAMHPAFYGGHSFFGRFWWPVVALWIFPMGFAIRSILKRNALTFSLICLMAIVLQIWLASKWLLQDGLMINLSVPVWASRSFFDETSLWRYLPAFRDWDAYLRHPGNYVAVVMGLLLVLSGWLWSKRRHLIEELWSVSLFIAVSSVALIPPSLGSEKLTGIDLPSEIGTLAGYDRVATEKNGPGWLTFGPYTTLMPGLYNVTLEYESSAAQRFDVVRDPGVNLIRVAQLPPSDINNGVFTVEFSVGPERSLNDLYEFRVRYLGQGDLKFKKLTITPISFDY